MTEAIIAALIGAAGAIIAAWIASRRQHPPAPDPTDVGRRDPPPALDRDRAAPAPAAPPLPRPAAAPGTDPSVAHPPPGPVAADTGDRPRGEHLVVLYVHDGTKRFTVTARMARARLGAVDGWATQQGYTRVELASGLDKTQADALRDQARADYEGRGYTYQRRS